MTTLKDTIKNLAIESAGEVISYRRHLHANPELSFEERETSAYVAGILKDFGLTPESMADTGLVAYVKGTNPDKRTIALRADMDALPIQEQNEVPYKSTNPGVMHACGHDVHTASLLGAAGILTRIRSSFEGTVKLIFQPGEERIPGGASIMIKEGVLQNPKVESILGQHVMPFIDAGKVGFRPGMYMASSDEIYLTVKGRGGHGAMPDQAIDPVLIASHIVVALQQVVSRNANPKIPSVLSFGKVRADGATNVIPEQVSLEGTFRTLDEQWRAKAKTLIAKIATGTAEAMGGSCEVNIMHGFPYLENDPELTNRTKAHAEEYLGKENVLDLDLWMAAEDFAFYSQQVSACFYRLGVRNEEKGITSSVHTPTFNVDEESLKVGAGLMAWLAVQELAE
ncbi:MAG: N-acyl-L-amino acid amidohydrolase [Cyclobacteriaceae bacterium]|nr:MAG: N-acyl-L-amino acid amidohydrolase [Cyclobacteriaceae bacterium]